TQLLPAPVTICGTGCPRLDIDVNAGDMVMLAASPGAGAYFSGFDAPCRPPSRSCNFQPTAPVTVDGHFLDIDHDLVFVTSAPLPSTASGLTGADQHCADRAAAGLLSGTYVSLVSDGTTSVVSRLGAARGFIRLDGLAVADTVSQLVVDH